MELVQEVDLFVRKALEISGAGGNGRGVVCSCWKCNAGLMLINDGMQSCWLLKAKQPEQLLMYDKIWQ